MARLAVGLEKAHVRQRPEFDTHRRIAQPRGAVALFVCSGQTLRLYGARLIARCKTCACFERGDTAWNHKLSAMAEAQQIAAATAHLARRASGPVSDRDARIERRFDDAPERDWPFGANGIAGFIGCDQAERWRRPAKVPQHFLWGIRKRRAKMVAVACRIVRMCEPYFANWRRRSIGIGAPGVEFFAAPAPRQKTGAKPDRLSRKSHRGCSSSSFQFNPWSAARCETARRVFGASINARSRCAFFGSARARSWAE